MSLEIRKANLNEFSRVRFFFQYCDKHSDFEHSVTKIDDSYLQEVINDGKVFLGFRYDTLIVALIIDRKGNEAWISQMTIHPSFYGKGVLNIIVQDALDKMRAQDVNTVHLYIPNDHPQQVMMFENCGFQKKGDDDCWYEYTLKEQ